MIHKQPGDLSASGGLDAKQISMIGPGNHECDGAQDSTRCWLCGRVRILYYLNSALGQYDGKVYEAYTEMATCESINQVEVVDSQYTLQTFAAARYGFS
ncbi:hypothetical protein BG005_002323, partial [Podila minutissima]